MGFGILSSLETVGFGVLCEMIPSDKSLPSHSPLTYIWDEKTLKELGRTVALEGLSQSPWLISYFQSDLFGWFAVERSP